MSCVSLENAIRFYIVSIALRSVPFGVQDTGDFTFLCHA